MTTKRTALVRVQMVKERTVTYETPGDVINGPMALAAAAREILGDLDREGFVVLHLNTKHRIVSMELVAIGTVNATLVHPREVFKGAILANATRIALAHNHPSGDKTPSPEDVALTRQLCQAGTLLGIEVVDHVILGDDSYISMRDMPMMADAGWA